MRYESKERIRNDKGKEIVSDHLRSDTCSTHTKIKIILRGFRLNLK